jgi:hypothetical protein
MSTVASSLCPAGTVNIRVSYVSDNKERQLPIVMERRPISFQDEPNFYAPFK